MSAADENSVERRNLGLSAKAWKADVIQWGLQFMKNPSVFSS